MIRLKNLVPDKSISHRAALIAALAEGESRIENFSPADDCLRTARAVRSLGCDVQQAGNILTVRGGRGFAASAPASELDMGNSGTAIRLLMGVLAGHPVRSVLTGDDSLKTRPMDRVARPLEKMGVRIEGQGVRLCAPVIVHGRRPLKAIEWNLDPASAQVKSAILFATLFADGESVIEESAPTRDHTERMFASAGVDVRRDGMKIRMKGGARPKPISIRVPEDFSAAAFFIAFGLLADWTDGIEMDNVGLNPTRTAFLDAVRLMGGTVVVQKTGDMAGEPVGKIVARPGALHGIELPVEWIPNLIDEIPVLSILAAAATGKTLVRGAAELRVKESDRIKSIVHMVRAFHGSIEERPDGFEIAGGNILAPAPAKFSTFADHRIAMSALTAAAALRLPVTVDNTECINTSFPGFFDCLGEINAQSHRH